MLQLSGTGLVRITASQSGNVSYLAAAPIVREFTAVAPAARAPMKLSSADKLPGGFSSTPTGISGDGSTLVGWATNAASNHEAFRGSPSNGITGLGDLPGGSFTSWANAVSQDGSVVVGYSSSTSGTQAFRWTSAGMVGMGDLPGGSFNSSANAVSQDGSVVVGYGGSSTGSEAFRWTQAGGMLPIGFLSGGNSSQAFGVSADGNTVVGVSTATGIPEMAFRWVALTGMTAIGDLPGGETRSRAAAISADGTVIVGQSTSARGREAFRWTTAGGMVGLGDLPGGNFESEALAVSADGSVVVGRAAVGGQSEAFMWDEANGMRKLSDVLNAAGLALGKSLVSATGISADGRFVTGSGTNAWLLDLNAPPPPAPTVALLWTENLPAAEPFRVDSVLRMSDENGSGKIDIATHIGSTTGGFNGVEYANGKILVPNQGISGGGIRTHHPDFSPLLVTNVFAYDLDEHPGELWNSNGNGQTITRSERSASPVISGGVYDYTYSALGSTNVGRFAFAIQKVGSTVYFSNPSNNPVGLYKMNSDGTGITSVLSASSSTAPVIYDFEVVGSFIYFGDITSNTIKRMNTDGSGLTTLVSVANFPNGIDVTDTAIYWSELQEGTIRRCDLNGGNLTELISGLNSPRGVAAAPISLLPVTDPLLAFLTNAGVPSNLRGPDDDPDGDQIPNLMEYALDLNPNGYGGSFTGTPPSIASTPTLLSYTYRRVRADVTYVVQTSPSLIGGTWTSGGVTQGMPAGDGTTTASIPVTPGSRFLRLSVSH
jgi:probable HAF family extracellular repeat protein